MNRPRTVPYLVGGAIIVVFCLLFRAAERGLHGFSINHAIDPVGLATLGVNIFIAFFLQYYFATRITDDRAEKDILIDTVRDAFSMLRTCRDEVSGCGTSKIAAEKQKKIISLYRALSNGLENVETAVEMSRCKELRKDFDSIRESFFKYKAAATGKFPYDASDISYQAQTYRALNQQLQSLAFKLNQYR